ncbi:MAG: hypothetical protein AAFU73_06415 [Planctomycetota bacterium]
MLPHRIYWISVLAISAPSLVNAQTAIESQGGSYELFVETEDPFTPGTYAQNTASQMLPSTGPIAEHECIEIFGPGSAEACILAELIHSPGSLRFRLRAQGVAYTGPTGGAAFNIEADLATVFSLDSPSRVAVTWVVDDDDGSGPAELLIVDANTGGTVISTGYSPAPVFVETFLASGSYRISGHLFDEGSKSGGVGAFSQGEVFAQLNFDPIGIRYCSGSVNSAGTVAELSLEGSPYVDDRDLAVRVEGGMPDQFGLLFYGEDRAFAPLGQSTLCVGGTIYRVGDPVAADPVGGSLFALDFASDPVGVGAGALSPGGVWRFQYWYRDPGGFRPFQLSSGIEVEFAPPGP